MLAHLELPPTQVEAFRAMANQVIIAVNDNKPLQNNLLDYGLIELSKAQQFKRSGELKVAQIPLDAGIQAISSALPDMHSMLHYKAHHTLTQLHQTAAEVQTALGNPEKAAAALEAANITHKFALLDGNSARFVAGFLEGLVNYQGTQFTTTQTQTLKRLLNFVANDVRPFNLLDLQLQNHLQTARSKEQTLHNEVSQLEHQISTTLAEMAKIQNHPSLDPMVARQFVDDDLPTPKTLENLTDFVGLMFESGLHNLVNNNGKVRLLDMLDTYHFY
jgi:hypothetical protein